MSTNCDIKTLQSDFLPEGRFPIVDQGKELIAGYTDDENRLCNADLPVIIFGDHTKCFKFIDFPFCLGADGTKVLRPKKEMDERYLFHALQTIHIPEAGYSRHFKYLKQGKIPLPPLAEQKRIAAILDKADQLYGLRQHAIDRLNALGQSIFHEMFGEKFDAQFHTTQISDIAKRVTKGESPKWQGHDYVDSGALFVTSENVGWGEMTDKEDKFIPLEFHEKLSRSKLRNGDILINLVGASIGRACIYYSSFENANINQAVSVVSINKNKSDQFVRYLLKFILSEAGQRQLLGSRVEGARANISLKNIREFSFYEPTEQELNAFSAREALISASLTHCGRALAHQGALFSSLVHRAFRGEL